MIKDLKYFWKFKSSYWNAWFVKSLYSSNEWQLSNTNVELMFYLPLVYKFSLLYPTITSKKVAAAWSLILGIIIIIKDSILNTTINKILSLIFIIVSFILYLKFDQLTYYIQPNTNTKIYKFEPICYLYIIFGFLKFTEIYFTDPNLHHDNWKSTRLVDHWYYILQLGRNTIDAVYTSDNPIFHENELPYDWDVYFSSETCYGCCINLI